MHGHGLLPILVELPCFRFSARRVPRPMAQARKPASRESERHRWCNRPLLQAGRMASRDLQFVRAGVDANLRSEKRRCAAAVRADEAVSDGLDSRPAVALSDAARQNGFAPRRAHAQGNPHNDGVFGSSLTGPQCAAYPEFMPTTTRQIQSTSRNWEKSAI